MILRGLKRRVISDTVFRLDMKNVSEMREGRQTTLQLFLVVKYFLSHVYSKTLFTECSYVQLLSYLNCMDVDMISSSYISSSSHYSILKRIELNE